MFKKEIYVKRRNRLMKDVGSGLILFLGNDESPMNYAANTYPFRQDSSFLYFWGLDLPGMAGILDTDNGQEILFGNDFTVDDIIWMGPQPKIAEYASRIGVKESKSLEALQENLATAVREGRKIHFLPPYRGDIAIRLEQLTGIHTSRLKEYSSTALIKAIVAQRAVKSAEEVAEIEEAIGISYEMNRNAMRLSRPGLVEHVVSGAVEGIVLSAGSRVSFPVIFSIHGETLHNHHHENVMEDGKLLVLDSGAESSLHYASDITRTFPVNGKFSSEQKAVYQICLKANMETIQKMKPGVPYRDLHILAATIVAQGMKDLGFMKGDVNDAVSSGAHALFFPHGLGHMLGLDVHDMENLGENLVGYDKTVKRSDQFGLAYLRMARKLEPGHVITVEPGIYFIPELIAQWKSQKKHTDFIQYTAVEKMLGFGGVRIEDDVLVTEKEHRVLGKPIAKTVEEVEAWCAAD